MINQIAQLAPKSLVQWLGRAQFRYPFLSSIINRAARSTRYGERRIRHGMGKGLLFDPAGSNPGYGLGTTEPKEQEFLQRHLTAGMVYFDVGANTGFHAVLASCAVGAVGRVVAFEPLPSNSKAIRENLARNKFEWAQVYEIALSDEEGVSRFALGREVTMGKLKRPVPTESVDTEMIDVTVSRLDAIMESESLPQPDMIKVDIEGAEIDFLRGAMQTIRASKPILLIEVHWLAERFTDFVAEHLVPLGYEVQTLDGRRELPRRPMRYHAVLMPLSYRVQQESNQEQ